MPDPGLRPESITELNRVVTAMRQYPELTIYLDGHTDSRQTDEYNQRLADKTFESRLQYLIRNGIDKKRLTKRSYR